MDKALLEQPLVYPTARIKAPTSSAEAEQLRALSPSEYWLAMAKELVWDKPPTKGLEGKLGDFTYFAGATGNVSVNCLDRWPAERMALLYEREDGLKETWTFGQLTDAVARFAAALEDLGVTKGDRVAVYASNVPEAFIAIHACYRIGAVYSVIFAGFSASAVRDRIEDAEPKVIVVTDATLRRGRAIPLKATLDEAMQGLPPATVIVARRVNKDYPLDAAKGELDFAEVLAKSTRKAKPVPIEANEPGFLIYTSGTTSKPKGLVHSGLGFLVGTYANVKWSLNLTPDDVYWCTADVGWLTMPIFALVGGLANGATHVIFEGSIDTPTPARPYEIMESYGVTKIFTAPTALRMMRRAGDALLDGARSVEGSAHRARRRAARSRHLVLDARQARQGEPLRQQHLRTDRDGHGMVEQHGRSHPDATGKLWTLAPRLRRQGAARRRDRIAAR